MTDGIRTFKGATAVITGAASGIGHAIAMELARRGSSLVLADRQIERAQEIARQICAEGGHAYAREVDVRDYQAVAALISEALTTTGRLDYLFNNAGIGVAGMVSELTVDDWDMTLDVNVRGVTNGIHACYNIMVAQGYGHIVNTASMAGLIPAPSFVAYSGSKFAVVGLSKALRIEAELNGIHVSVLCPGAIDTPILSGGVYGKLPTGIDRAQAQKYWAPIRPMAPETFAKRALDDIAKNVPVIILPRRWRLIHWLCELSPRLWYWASKKDLRRAQRLLNRVDKP